MKGKRGQMFSGLSKTDLAEAKKVSLNTVYGWVRRGCPVNDNGTFTLSAVDAFLTSRDKKKAGSLEYERARLAREQADKVARENAVARGEYVHIEDSAAMLEFVVMAIRAKVLGMGSKISPHVVGVNGIAEAKGIIDVYAHELLREIADIDPRRAIRIAREETATGASAAEPDRK